MKRNAQKLGNDVYTIDSAVKTIANRYVDESILTGQGDSGLGSNFSEWEKSGTATTTEDQRNHLAHIIEHQNHVTYTRKKTNFKKKTNVVITEPWKGKPTLL